jgi:hypothetical protein
MVPCRNASKRGQERVKRGHIDNPSMNSGGSKDDQTSAVSRPETAVPNHRSEIPLRELANT